MIYLDEVGLSPNPRVKSFTCTVIYVSRLEGNTTMCINRECPVDALDISLRKQFALDDEFSFYNLSS